MPSPFLIQAFKQLIVLLIVIFISNCNLQLVDAKLGDPIEKFQQRMASSFKLISKETKGTKVYYHFSLISNGEEQKLSAGFGSGLTITTLNGHIIGESLLTRIGNDQENAEKLAAVLCLNLAYDALGKAVPVEEKDRKAEFSAYKQAVSQAFSGQPGHIKYPGHTSELIFSRTNSGDLLFAINSDPKSKNP